MVDKQEETNNYYNSIAQGYDELHGEEQLKKYRVIASKLNLKGGEEVLDVGAGTGIGFSVIPSVGIDPSSELIKKHPNPKSLVGVAEKLPFPDQSFDAVICVTAIHHADYEKALLEMKRVSRGPIAVSVLKKSPLANGIIACALQHFKPLSIVDEEKDRIIIHKPIETVTTIKATNKGI